MFQDIGDIHSRPLSSMPTQPQNEVRTGEGQSLQVQKAVAVGAAGLAIAIGAGFLAAGVAGLLSSDRKGKKTDSDSDSKRDTHAQ